MKHSSFFSIICIILLGMIGSCSKVSHNGNLDGRWRMKECYSKASTDDAHYTLYTNKMENQIYWNFQLKLLQITSGLQYNGKTCETICRFAYEEDRLSITSTYVHFRDRDSLITDPNTTSLVELGIRGNASNYHIKRLTSTEMILCSDMDSLIFYQLH